MHTRTLRIASWTTGVAVALGASTLVACTKKRSPNPGEASDSGAMALLVDASRRADVDAGEDAAAGVVAYSDDVVEGRASRVVTAPDAKVLTSMPTGTVVASLAKGSTVTTLAERHGFYRIEAPASGWVVKYAFDEPAVGPIAPAPVAPKKKPIPRCSGTSKLVLLDEPRCAYPCKNDRECVTTTCEVAIELASSGERPAVPTYETVCAASGPASGADAGAPSLFGLPHGGDGKCPRGFTAAPKVGALCYRSCKVDGDCPQDSTCKRALGNVKLCFAN